MRILVAAATRFEIAPVAQALGADTASAARVMSARTARHHVDLLITGVGMVPAAAWCARQLAGHHYDLALNAGVCGTFDPAGALGEVVHVTADRMAELGAESGAGFLSIHDLKLLEPDEFPFTGGALVNAAPPPIAPLSALRRVSGVTVNTVHGDDASIARVVARFAPDVESMEGAGFMYACLIHGVAFAQVRAISNVVERRNREAWKMPDAIARLGETALQILDGA
jgi:futalosine hydrolase